MRTLKMPAILAIVLWVASGCGVEVVPALQPPEFDESSLIAWWFRIKISSSTAANPYFLGVEYYYRFYPQGATIDSDLTTLQELVNNGFLRLSSATDTETALTKPLLLVPAAATITLTIDPNTDPDDAFVNTTPVRRGVWDSGIGQFKSFEAFEVGDGDILAFASAQTYHSTRFVLYALSYGTKDFVSLYSPAAYLQFIDFDIVVKNP